LTSAPRALEGAARLILGTAQFSDDYGIMRETTRGPTTTVAPAVTILEAAEQAGIQALDTAPAYGASEEFIGSSGWTGAIATKLDAKLEPRDSVERSLALLGRAQLDLLYVHDVKHFLRSGDRAVSEMERLRGSLVKALGVSAYEPAEVAAALARLDFDVVQLPLNPFDNRLTRALQDGLLPVSCTYVARSVFLQGLLAQPALAIGRAAVELRPALAEWQRRCEEIGVAPGEAALIWVLAQPFLKQVIVGADSVTQLREIIAWSQSDHASEILEVFHGEDLWPLSDPRTWVANGHSGRK
jgi:aryl-alcohol dehydrogenase-like predicted oxidoreductase